MARDESLLVPEALATAEAKLRPLLEGMAAAWTGMKRIRLGLQSVLQSRQTTCSWKKAFSRWTSPPPPKMRVVGRVTVTGRMRVVAVSQVVLSPGAKIKQAKSKERVSSRGL
jgi:hypothetical protein